MNPTSKRTLPEMMKNLSEFKSHVEKLKGYYAEINQTQESDPQEHFLAEEIEAIMIHLDDTMTDISYLESPYLTEGKLRMKGVTNELMVNDYKVNLSEPVEIQLGSEDNWIKTWIGTDSKIFYFTCFGRVKNALDIQCNIRLRRVHEVGKRY